MKIRFLRGCLAKGIAYGEGETVNLDDKTARELIHCRRAIALGDGVDVADPSHIANRDPNIRVGDAVERVMAPPPKAKRGSPKDPG